jgi:hypothetical protein
MGTLVQMQQEHLGRQSGLFDFYGLSGFSGWMDDRVNEVMIKAQGN